MSRNQENFQLVNLGPFVGMDKNTDQQDTPERYFVDGENLVCTDQKNSVETRPGTGPWMVDENGFGVVFSEPFVILPGGGHAVDGVITPPAAVPIGSTPDVLVDLSGDPPNVQTDGPGSNNSFLVDDDDDSDGDIPPPPPPPPVYGSISLAARPSSGLWVDASTDAVVVFTVTENLPTGVTIASYSWDFVWLEGTTPVADASGAALTQNKTYDNDDPERFWVRVWGLGSNGITYYAKRRLRLAHKEDDVVVETDGYIAIVQPMVGSVAADVDFPVGIAYFEKDADTSEYVLTATSNDTVITQVGGSAELLDSGGGALAADGKTITFTAADMASTDLQATLQTDIFSGDLTILATQEDTGFTAQKTISVMAKKIEVEIVDSAGSGISYDDFTYDDPDLLWTFYVKLTAKEADGTVVTDFAENVRLSGVIDLENSNWTQYSALNLIFAGYDANAPYDSATATTTYEFGHIDIPSTLWADGDAGIVTIKVDMTKAWTDQQVYDPTQNPNASYAQYIFTGEVV